MAWRVPPRLAANVIYALYRPWCMSLRLTEVNREPFNALVGAGKPAVLALWHNECFTLIWLKQALRMLTIASQSRDGEYISGVLEHLGFEIARGSSSRGGLKALLTSVRLMRDQGLLAAVTVDGPRGPRHQVKDGALFLAHRAGAPIIPVRAFPERCIRFKSWDRFEIPYPFSRVRVVFGDPYTIDAQELSPDVLATECAKLETRLRDLEFV